MIVVAACLPGGTESTSDNAPSGGDGTSIATEGGSPGDSSESGSQPGTPPIGNASPLPGSPGGPIDSTAPQASPGDGGIPGVDSQCICGPPLNPGEVPGSAGGGDNAITLAPETDPLEPSEQPTLGPIVPDEEDSTGIG
jgi:hypothetical protein